jgi:probable F420-dependent oxidoreductase
MRCRADTTSGLVASRRLSRRHLVQFGVVPAFGGEVQPTGAYLAAIVSECERSGFESVWVGEHIALPVHQHVAYPGSKDGLAAPVSGPLPDPIEWLTYASARSSTLILGTAILLANLHHPLTLAKRVATLDQLSGGRVRLGVGLGWNAQEYASVGVPFNERGARLEEHIDALRTIWRDEQPEYHGRFVDFEPMYSSPKPANGRVPILIGGDSVAAARRAGRIGDGYFPFGRDAMRTIELIAVMREAAAEAGRDPKLIEVSTIGTLRRENAEALAEAGISRLVYFLPAPDPASIGQLGNRCRAVLDGL